MKIRWKREKKKIAVENSFFLFYYTMIIHKFSKAEILAITTQPYFWANSVRWILPKFQPTFGWFIYIRCSLITGGAELDAGKLYKGDVIIFLMLPISRQNSKWKNNHKKRFFCFLKQVCFNESSIYWSTCSDWKQNHNLIKKWCLA